MLEVCVDSPPGLSAAIEGGADRIELCSALSLGGLTPASGLIAQAKDAPVPVRAMIRPRSGNFTYDARELDAMLNEIDAVRAAGLDGVVIGAIDRSGALDFPLLEKLVAHSDGLKVTLHRAVGRLPDPVIAVETAIELDIDAILTSGGAGTAIEGAATIRAMHDAARDRINIMAGSGVRTENASELRQATGLGWFHASCSVAARSSDAAATRLGFVTGQERVTDAATVAALRAVLREGVAA